MPRLRLVAPYANRSLADDCDAGVTFGRRRREALEQCSVAGHAPRVEVNVTLRDHRGLSLSAGTPRGIERYEQALGSLHIYCGNPVAIIDEALAEDPSFIAGHALRAALMVTTSERRALPELQKSVEAG